MKRQLVEPSWQGRVTGRKRVGRGNSSKKEDQGKKSKIKDTPEGGLNARLGEVKEGNKKGLLIKFRN